MKPTLLLVPLALLAALAASCAAPLNFTDARGPRYAGCCIATAPAEPESLRLVTFNIEFAVQIERAIGLLQNQPELRNADVIFLQEMDVVGTRRIAHAMGLNYVYYPALLHPLSGRPFGDAILARWPIEDDKKIVLPHLGRFGRTQRIAVAGTIRVAGRSLRLYSVHLMTGIESRKGWHRDQVAAIAADADSTHADGVIIGGDFNSERLPRALDAGGYSWVTRALPSTTSMLSLDHFFLRGVELTNPQARGVVTDNHGASDHNPLWVTVDLRGN